MRLNSVMFFSLSSAMVMLIWERNGKWVAGGSEKTYSEVQVGITFEHSRAGSNRNLLLNRPGPEGEKSDQ